MYTFLLPHPLFSLYGLKSILIIFLSSFVFCLLMCQLPLNKPEYTGYKAFYVATQILENVEHCKLNSCPISKFSRKFYE